MAAEWQQTTNARSVQGMLPGATRKLANQSEAGMHLVTLFFQILHGRVSREEFSCGTKTRQLPDS